MRILLTRAHDEAMRSADKLAARGHQVMLSPVLEMVPTGAQWPQGLIDAVIATSAQGFELAQFPPQWPLPEVRRLMPLFLVGGKTAEAAWRCGFEGEVTLAPDAKDLAATVTNRMHPPARLLYLAGHDRKSDLEIHCKEAGLDITTVEIYEARAAQRLADDAIAALVKGEIDAVLHYSRRSAEIFLALCEAADIDPGFLRHIAISPDAAAPLQAKGLASIAIANEPNEQAMLALLSDDEAAGSTASAAPHEL